jgi:thiamine biosynthesis protein ThiI
LERNKTPLTVNLDNPDLKIYLKLRKDKVFLYTKIEKAVGGLPVGSSGQAIAMFSGGIDSPVAAFLAMKRGLEITAVHFHSVPQTSEKSIEKVKELVQELSKYQDKIKLYLIPIIPLQKNIVQKAERKLSIVLQRRAFLKLGQMVAEKEEKEFARKNLAFVTGDSLGQVASQTLENMAVVSEILNDSGKIVLRPLITYDKKEIMDLAKKIGTLKISEKPHDDACSLFVPKNPETKANLKKVLNEEKKLDESILEDVLNKAEIEIIKMKVGELSKFD